MRDLRLLSLYRRTDDDVRKYYGGVGDHETGVFQVAGLLVIASSGMGWDHVSVSRRDRTPTWEEMARVKKMFFKDDETVMQLHVPISDHINCHPNCLHLWRPQEQEIPRPPSVMVGK